jgi:preprotein translocase subunit SecF
MKINFAKWGNELHSGKKSYDIVGKRKYWFIISGVLTIIFLLLLIKPGLNLGIDFKGGSQFTISNVKTQSQSIATDIIHKFFPNEEPSVSSVGTNAMRVQTKQLTNEEVENIRSELAKGYGVEANNVTSSYIGASWGADVSSKALKGCAIFIILAMLAMALYFKAWRMALGAIGALLHDLIITVGIYALVGWEVTPATLIGFLTILGYSIYDTVVVFDKVRENTNNVLDQSVYTYKEAANLAVNQTLVRSINTSVVALLPVTSILFIGAFVLGAGTLRDIALALFVGMATGTFSSIFIATPLEVTLREQEPKIKEHTNMVLEKRANAVGDDGQTQNISSQTAAMHIALKPGYHKKIVHRKESKKKSAKRK